MLPRGSGFKERTPRTERIDRRVKSEEREGFPGRGQTQHKGLEDFREKTASSGNTQSKKPAGTMHVC